MTGRQRRFAAEYVVDGNGTQAAIRAGYSPRRAAVTASELLTRPDVRFELARLRGEVEVPGPDASVEEHALHLVASARLGVVSARVGLGALELLADLHGLKPDGRARPRAEVIYVRQATTKERER